MRLKDVEDVRESIKRNFFVQEVIKMQKKNQLDHNDSAKIEECVMKDREKYIMSKDVKKQQKKVKKCIITEGNNRAEGKL